jgi:RNA polymerase sigma-70 factor (ECF subfamily)
MPEQMEHWTDGRLLSATRAGAPEAYGIFFARHAETVLRYIRRRTGDSDLAAELTAETFAAALLSVHRGHAERVENGAAWALSIARHKLVDSYRRGQAEQDALRQLGIDVQIDDGDLARIDELAGQTEHLRVALSRLSADERDAIVERVLRDRDYDEIARSAAQSSAVIRQRVSRGLARLRHAMGARP